MPASHSSSDLKQEFSLNDLIHGLRELSGRLRALSPTEPFVIIVKGGILEVHLWRSRAHTPNCEFVLAGDHPPEIHEFVERSAQNIATQFGWHENWFYDAFDAFPEDAEGNVDQKFLQQCIHQNCVVFKSGTLMAYAVKWEWALSSQLRTIVDLGVSVRRPHALWDDAVRILLEIVHKRGAPLSQDEFKDILLKYCRFSDKDLKQVTVDMAGVYEKYVRKDGIIRYMV